MLFKMSLIILGIILSIINYVHCVEFNFTSYPEKIVPGEIMDIQFDIIGNSNNTEYTIDFSLCQSVEFSSCIPLDQMITNDDNNSKGLVIIILLININIRFFFFFFLNIKY